MKRKKIPYLAILRKPDANRYIFDLLNPIDRGMQRKNNPWAFDLFDKAYQNNPTGVDYPAYYNNPNDFDTVAKWQF